MARVGSIFEDCIKYIFSAEKEDVDFSVLILKNTKDTNAKSSTHIQYNRINKK